MFIQWMSPPILVDMLRPVWSRLNGAATWEFRLAPKGRGTQWFPEGTEGWNSRQAAASKSASWEAFNRHLRGPAPLSFPCENIYPDNLRNVLLHNDHITYGYVLALAAHRKDLLAVLDWGGGMGHYYQLGKALLPGVQLAYHCMEVPLMAEAGQRLNPEVHWHTNRSYLSHAYDLVIANGSLQYVEDWVTTLRELCQVIQPGGYLFLGDAIFVEKETSFVVVQRAYGIKILCHVFNRWELLKSVEDNGLGLVREFIDGCCPRIKGSRERGDMGAWLFKKSEAVG